MMYPKEQQEPLSGHCNGTEVCNNNRDAKVLSPGKAGGQEIEEWL
jgi:hypothetical protein